MTQPEALRLADALEVRGFLGTTASDAAAELRRLHELNQELVEFAEEVRRSGDTRLANMAIATIAKVTGENK